MLDRPCRALVETDKKVMQASKNSQKTLFKPKPLTVAFVFSNLRDIALSSGHSVSYWVIHIICIS